MKTVGLFLGFATLVLPGTAAPAAAPRPNVLMIVVDDLGFSDLGAYGGEIPTPNIDRLASAGMRFTQFYNCGVCEVTRTAIYGGRYPRPNEDGLKNGMVTLGESMHRAGYATAHTGKWHLGDKAPNRPIDRGFEESYGLLSGASNHFNPAKQDPLFYNEKGSNRLFVHNEKVITQFPADYYTTDAFSSNAAETIRRAAKSNRPFFLSLCYTAPHFPLQAPEADIARHRGKYRGGYDLLREQRFRRQIEMGLVDPGVTKLTVVESKTGTYRYEYEARSWQGHDSATRKREEERMEVYAAMVERLDEGIGRVLAALEESGLAGNTAVFFVSDNGGCTRWSENDAKEMAGFVEYNRGIPVGDGRGYEFLGPGWGWAQNTPFRRAKAWTYEGGICTPMIVRWPGVVKAGVITNQPGHVVDFMPTMLEMAGGKHPGNFGAQASFAPEGQSLGPILRGGVAPPRQGPMTWALRGNRAIREGAWKLVWGANKERWELYDLASDRSETSDLSRQHPERAAAMAAAWYKWAKQTSDPKGG